jgi:hypothetical protein
MRGRLGWRPPRFSVGASLKTARPSRNSICQVLIAFWRQHPMARREPRCSYHLRYFRQRRGSTASEPVSIYIGIESQDRAAFSPRRFRADFDGVAVRSSIARARSVLECRVADGDRAMAGILDDSGGPKGASFQRVVSQCVETGIAARQAFARRDGVATAEETERVGHAAGRGRQRHHECRNQDC